MPPQQLDNDIVNLARAVRKIESGDNFSARGGSGEYGGYQYTPATWASHARAAGVNVPLEKATRADQNKVFYTWAKSKKDSGKNIGEIASMHNAGEGRPNAYLEGNAGTNKYGVQYDTKSYAEKVAKAYQEIKAQGGGYQVPTDVQTPQNSTQSYYQNLNAPAAEEPKKDWLDKTNDIFQTFFPTRNIGEAIGTGLAKAGLFTTPETVKYVDDSKATLGGIAGDVAQNAALFIGGGAIPAIRGATTAARVGQGALQGAKWGALAGGVGGGGRALSEGGDIVDAGVGALGGAALGGVTGGAIGGLVPAIPGIAGRAQRAATGGVQSKASIVEDMVGANAAGRTSTRAADDLARASAQEQRAAGAVVQGKGDEAEAKLAAKVLPTVDTTGVKTYKELNNRIQQKIDEKLSTVDKAYAGNTDKKKLKDLAQEIDSGIPGSKLKRSVNYVEDSLKQLKTYYNSTRDLKSALRIQATIAKARKEGLSASEINAIAREHGRELTGFNANGELASGLSKQAAENTRKGIKETARAFLQDDVARTADLEVADLIRVKEMTEKVETAVNKLTRKVEERGLLKKVGRAIGKTIDFTTGGFFKGIFNALIMESNVGLKSMNSMQIEENLSKNLKLLEALNGAPEADLERWLRAVIGGNPQQ